MSAVKEEKGGAHKLLDYFEKLVEIDIYREKDGAVNELDVLTAG